MITRDQHQQFSGLIQFPSDTQNAARQLNLDMDATNSAAQGAGGNARVAWDAFYAAWKAYFAPIDDSWAYNPVGAAAFADQATIEDWRKRMKIQQAGLIASGGDAGSMPLSPVVTPDSPLSPLTDALGSLKWIVVGGLALYLAFRFIPTKGKR